MDLPRPAEILQRLRALPAALPLLERLVDPAGAYVVGGAVRDLLRGGRPVDLDLVVEGDAAAFAARLNGALRSHDRFGTSTVTLDGHSYDIARSRRERYPQPGALPEVEPAPIEQDLLRRDFTVNTFAIALGPPEPGRLLFAPGAVDDLETTTLRVLHDRSFEDDPTRLLRLARYVARLGFGIDPRTRELAADAIAAGAIRTVSGARIGTELRLLAREQDPVAAYAALAELGLDRSIHPAFGLRDRQAAARALALLPADGDRGAVVIAMAARGIGRAQLRLLLDELAFEAAQRDAIVQAATESDRAASALESARRPSEIGRALAGLAPETVAIAGALGPHGPAREWLERLRQVGLEIDGQDLIAAGVPKGPAIGHGLRAALAAKLDGEVDGREAELARALAAARSAPAH